MRASGFAVGCRGRRLRSQPACAIGARPTVRYIPRPTVRYTGAVDRVRLGRALGYGTRHMAKTVAAIAEAAAASPAGTNSASSDTPASPHRPVPPQVVPPQVLPPRPFPLQPAPRHEPHRGTQPPGTHSTGTRTQHLKRSFLHPLAVYSGALWLRVTGSFFALLAATMGSGAWRLRADLRAGPRTPAGPTAAYHFWIFMAFTALFGYFAVSSFVRASVKERRAQTSS